MGLRNQRPSWIPHPFAVTDDELRSGIHREEECQLRGEAEREPPRTDGKSAASGEEPTSHEQRALDEQIIDRTPIGPEPEPGPGEGRRLAAGEDISGPVQ